MIRSLYSSLSSMITLENQQTVISNNLANANTTGFKSDVLISKSFDDVYIANKESGVIGKLSLGSQIDTVAKNFTQGDLKGTSKSSDFAISGRGFFVVKRGNEQLYTRNGKFSVGSNGTLVTESGDQVMGKNMKTGTTGPIFVGNSKYTLGENNVLNVDGIGSYQMLTADFKTYASLAPTGDNYYRGENPIMDSVVSVNQGYVEGSGVNISNEMINMMTTLRNFESSQSVFKMIDNTLEISANSIGKV